MTVSICVTGITNPASYVLCTFLVSMELPTNQDRAMQLAAELDLFGMTSSSVVREQVQRVQIIQLFKVQIRFQLKCLQLL